MIMQYYFLSTQQAPLDVLFDPSDTLIYPSDRIREIIRMQDSLSNEETLYFRDEIVKEILSHNTHQIFIFINNFRLSFSVAAFLIMQHNSTIWAPRFDWEQKQQGTAKVFYPKITGKERLVW
jgi:hypothetical protein